MVIIEIGGFKFVINFSFSPFTLIWVKGGSNVAPMWQKEVFGTLEEHLSPLATIITLLERDAVSLKFLFLLSV